MLDTKKTFELTRKCREACKALIKERSWAKATDSRNGGIAGYISVCTTGALHVVGCALQRRSIAVFLVQAAVFRGAAFESAHIDKRQTGLHVHCYCIMVCGHAVDKV